MNEMCLNKCYLQKLIYKQPHTSEHAGLQTGKQLPDTRKRHALPQLQHGASRPRFKPLHYSLLKYAVLGAESAGAPPW